MPTVIINKLDEGFEYIDSLYCHYTGQTQPQDVYVFLDLETGKLSTDIDHNIGTHGIPEHVFRGTAIRWFVNTPGLFPSAANELMQSLESICQRLLDMYNQGCHRICKDL